MAFEARLGVTQNNPPEPVNWGVQLGGADRTTKRPDQAQPVLVAAANDVPVVIGGKAQQGEYPTTVRPVDIAIIRQLIKEGPTLAGMTSGAVFEQFLNNYNDRSHEATIPDKIVLYDASTNPALKEKAGWAAATDPALYQIDPNLSGVQAGRNLKPVRDLGNQSNAKSPDSFYVIGYQRGPDGQLRPADVLEYYNDHGKTRYKDQYLFKYDVHLGADGKPDGTDVVSIFKYRAADQSRGPDNSDAVGTIPIGANHRPNILEGMTQYFRYKGQTYDMKKWGGAQLQLGADELSATPKPPTWDAAINRAIPNVPETEISFQDTTTQTIGEGKGTIVRTVRNHSLGPAAKTVSGRDALQQTFLDAPQFYFYDPFGPKIPKQLQVHHPTPYDR